jgi:membrane fusion protein, multidrug efflux system
MVDRSIEELPMRFGLLLAVVGLLVPACRPAVPPVPPPPEVSIITVAPRHVEETLDFVGDVQAFRTVQVRAQATGVILQRLFQEGATVHAGDVLYKIDPTIAEAEWRSAKGRLAEAQARQANSLITLNRLRPLLAGHAVATQDVDNAEAAAAQARAAVDDARGAVDAAQKALDEMVVHAEISGRVGRALLDVGTRVTGSSDVLTTIDMLDPIYVSFQPSAQQQFGWGQDPRARTVMSVGGAARVQAILPDGRPAPSIGRISFVDPVVDPQTGTQQYRAQFSNPNRLLLPGQYVHVHVLGLVRDNAVLIPQRAVLEQMGRQIVYVVGRGDTVALREVKTSEWSGSDWLIEQGLTAGDRVIVDGVQKVGPGSVVHPTAFTDSSKAPQVGVTR